MFQTKFVDKIKTQISFSKNVLSDDLVVYDIMLNNIVEADSPQMTLQQGASAL
jgi:hypothetical protein